MRTPGSLTFPASTVLRRMVLASVLATGLGLIAVPRPAAAADPTPPAPAEPQNNATPTATPQPTASPDPPATPEPTLDPAPTPTTDPSPGLTPGPTLVPSPTSPPVAPPAMNLFGTAQFRFQDPNWAACTATSVRTMLNVIAARGTGGTGFVWRPTVSGAVRDMILAWERVHDTMPGGHGSDPHGWRNALNFYGWGPGTLLAGSRVYDDVTFATYTDAMKAAVRALAATGKPVGMLGWRGRHAQMITGYFGLTGDPFARDETGHYTDAFSVAGFYVTDPLRAAKAVNRLRSFTTLRITTNYRVRFQRYYQTDSRYDDPYTPGYLASRLEWYGRFVLVLPLR